MNKMSLNTVLLTLSIGMVSACSDTPPASQGQDGSSDIAPAAQTVDKPRAETGEVQRQAATTTKRSAESHTHGDAELAVVLEGNVVTIELDTPLYNLLGFEHAPKTEAQKTTASRAEKNLGQGKGLFSFNQGAGCELISNIQDIHLFEHESREDEHDDHDDEHDDHHDEDHHEEHSEDAHDDETHKDVILQYEFQCQKPSSLSNVSVNLFEFFSELSEIDVTYLGPSTQRQVKMTQDNSQMDMQP